MSDSTAAAIVADRLGACVQIHARGVGARGKRVAVRGKPAGEFAVLHLEKRFEDLEKLRRRCSLRHAFDERAKRSSAFVETRMQFD